MGLESIIKKDSTSYILEIAIRSSATGQLLAGLTDADMTIEYERQGAAAHVSITPVAGTLGTWSSGSWVESIPGIYQFGVPNAALATGADFVVIVFTSAGALDADILIYLTASDTIVIGGPTGPYILTPAEAAAVLRVSDEDADMLALLPLVDRYIINATGYDWRQDETIREDAKSAARMLLVMWHENPAMIGTVGVLEFGLNAALMQLEVIALRYRWYKFYGRNGAGPIALAGAAVGDTVESLIGIYIASGDASSSFEETISVDGCLQQTSGSDLSANLYLAKLKPADALDP